MLEAWGLTPELIAGGVVGLTMVGVVARQVILGWREANTHMKTGLSPITTAVAMTWDRDQVERTIQALETIAESQSIIAKAQSILADQFQQTTHSKLNDLMDMLEHVDNPNSKPRAPRRR